MSFGKNIASLILLVAGFAVIFDYFINVPGLSDIANFLQILATVLAAFALGLGAVSLFRVHFPRVTRRGSEWYLSAWMLIVLGIVAVVGVFGTTNHPIFKWMYSNMILPLDATLFSLLGFFIISAAYRAFRARTLDATVLLLAGAAVMLMNMPVGAVMWSGFPVIGGWVRDIAGVAGYRGIYLALVIGLVAYSLRVMIGYERPLGD
jgi:hypothetical protein